MQIFKKFIKKKKKKKIKIEKYLTPEQKKQLEEQQQEEIRRRELEKLDNWRERGLIDMMGGVLQIRREDELKKVKNHFNYKCLMNCELSLSIFKGYTAAAIHEGETPGGMDPRRGQNVSALRAAMQRASWRTRKAEKSIGILATHFITCFWLN